MDLLKHGLCPAASDALRRIGITADRITQTIGHAAASAGVHEQDGEIDGHPYCAAVDLSAHGLTVPQVVQLLDRLGEQGFAAWYRQPGHDHWPASDALHVHAVYAGVKMKAALRSQIHDFCHGKNGLASHTVYHFHPPTAASIAAVRSHFLASGNPVNG